LLRYPSEGGIVGNKSEPTSEPGKQDLSGFGFPFDSAQDSLSPVGLGALKDYTFLQYLWSCLSWLEFSHLTPTPLLNLGEGRHEPFTGHGGVRSSVLIYRMLLLRAPTLSLPAAGRSWHE
jgi:hypothetical protein